MKSSLCLALMLCSGTVLAAQPYCEKGFRPIGGKDLELDLSKLNEEFAVWNNITTPPTVTATLVEVNLCNPLTNIDDGKFTCEKGSLICRRVINEIDHKEQVNIVQTIAKEDKPNDFHAVKPDDDATANGFQYSLSLNGAEWNKQSQSAQITLECDTSQSRNDKPSAPTIIGYNNNVLTLQWKTVFACATKAGEKVPDDKTPPPSNPPPSESKGMSGIGIFFTIVFVLAGVYFVGGAIYNFKMYNARGLDLIPHRDFWFDLPYLIRDLFAHIVDSVMSHRRGSGGYVAV